jgi:hypothetical protein
MNLLNYIRSIRMNKLQSYIMLAGILLLIAGFILGYFIGYSKGFVFATEEALRFYEGKICL